MQWAGLKSKKIKKKKTNILKTEESIIVSGAKIESHLLCILFVCLGWFWNILNVFHDVTCLFQNCLSTYLPTDMRLSLFLQNACNMIRDMYVNICIPDITVILQMRYYLK